MNTGKEKMLNDELFDPQDPRLVAARRRARLLLKELNDSRDERDGERTGLIRELIPECGKDVWFETPFFCEYGSNISLGDGVRFDFNCVVIDAAPVRIGARVQIGPAVQLYAGGRPLDAATRRTGLELGRPVEIGDDAWIGGGSVICPGVRIGPRAVIGAGSVVTRDIPADVVAAGNPCRVLHALDE